MCEWLPEVMHTAFGGHFDGIECNGAEVHAACKMDLGELIARETISTLRLRRPSLRHKNQILLAT